MAGPRGRAIVPEAELVGDSDQPRPVLDADQYEAGGEGAVEDEEEVEGTAWAFERQAEQAKLDASLDKELEETFPTSDPSSSWAGAEVEPGRLKDDPAR